VLAQAVVVPSADYEIALVGALGRRMGLLVLAGTGSLAYGVNSARQSALAGAWGYLVGDEGSGYWLGAEGLRAVLRAADGRGSKTALHDILLPALGLAKAQDVIPWLYGGPVARTTEIAGLASLLLETARTGDSCAAEIVSRAADELALAARAVMERLQMREPPIALAGGLLSASNPLSDALCARLGLADLPRPLYSPVMGAVLLARDTIRDASSGPHQATGDSL
jgi:N-acetylglucosamine kinase-like BadF-type ATPase